MGLRTFSFDGISSDTFNLFITEAMVYSVPERAVEMLEIPGRNGFYALDQGRFNNTEVTYHVVVDGSDDADFSEEIADVREWLCSGTGYKRLEDDYNPNEYRMAVYRNGFETDEAFWNGAEFDITFDCKPQRWLTSGETAVSVTSGDEVDNPTRFDAEPLLEVKGYGGIEFNGYEIDVEDAVLGNIYDVDGDNFTAPKTYTINDALVNNGDAIKVRGELCTDLSISDTNISYSLNSISDSNAYFESTSTSSVGVFLVPVIAKESTLFNVEFVAGTSGTISNTVTARYVYIEGFDTRTAIFTITQTIQYNASAKTITVNVSTSATAYSGTPIGTNTTSTITIVEDSTVSALGNPTYIDCEIGEAYMIKNGDIVSCNQAVALGSDLPKLAPGANTITFDNTVTELKIHPRWWRV